MSFKPGRMAEQQAKLATRPGRMAEQQAKLATRPGRMVSARSSGFVPRHTQRRAVLWLISTLVLQVPGAVEMGEEVGNSEAYSGSSWYFSPPSPRPNGVSLFSAGYNAFRDNFNLNVRMLNMGLGPNVDADTGIHMLFFGRLGLRLGYTLLYPWNFPRYDLVQHYGSFAVSWYPKNATLENDSRLGRINGYFQNDPGIHPILLYRNISRVNVLLVNRPGSLRFDAQGTFIYENAPNYNDHFYEVDFGTVFVQDHGFGEIALRPFLSYTNSIGEARRVSPQKNFLKNTTFSFLPPEFYNFAAAALFEYRFYVLSFLDSYRWYEDFYIAANCSLAYIHDESSGRGRVKMYYGGGLGFNLFGSVPFSFQLILDESGRFGFSFFTSIVPGY